MPKILSGPDEVALHMAMVRADAATVQSISKTRGEQVRASLAKRVILRLTPFRYASWDHARLGEFY